MTLLELIERLEQIGEQNTDGDAEVVAQIDARNTWEPVTAVTFEEGKVVLR